MRVLTAVFVVLLAALVYGAVHFADRWSTEQWRSCLEEHIVCVQENGKVVPWTPSST